MLHLCKHPQTMLCLLLRLLHFVSLGKQSKQSKNAVSVAWAVISYVDADTHQNCCGCCLGCYILRPWAYNRTPCLLYRFRHATLLKTYDNAVIVAQAATYYVLGRTKYGNSSSVGSTTKSKRRELRTPTSRSL